MNTDNNNEVTFSVRKTEESQCIKGWEFSIVPTDGNNCFLKIKIGTMRYVAALKKTGSSLVYSASYMSSLRDKIISREKIFDWMSLKLDECQKLKDTANANLLEFREHWN